MQIILDNIIYSLQKAGGISVYWTELIKRIPSENISDVIEYSNENIHRKEVLLQNNISRSNIFISLKRYLSPLFIKSSKTIFHSSYYRHAFGKNIINIITIHDFTFEKFLKKRKGAFIHILQKKRGILKADGIICVSENTKIDLIKYYPQVDPNKIRVIYNGVNEVFKLKSDNTSNDFNSIKAEKYILFVGSRISYKNFDKAVAAVKLLKGIKIFVVGNEFDEKELEMLENLIPERYRLFKNIENNILKVLYEYAFCLLYPSSYEGFGIPIAEAMCCGCPVIALNKSSVPEVAGACAVLIDEPKPKLIAKAVISIENEEFRRELIRKGEIQGNKFSWDKMAAETIHFYKEIYAK